MPRVLFKTLLSLQAMIIRRVTRLMVWYTVVLATQFYVML